MEYVSGGESHSFLLGNLGRPQECFDLGFKRRVEIQEVEKWKGILGRGNSIFNGPEVGKLSTLRN